MTTLRTGLAVALSAAMIAAPALAATAHHKTVGSHPSTANRAVKSSHVAPHAKGAKRTAAPAEQSSTASGGAVVKGKHSSRKAAIRPPKLHGQQGIQPERVTAIQQALIREHYLSGEASGNWDNETVAAMQKFQADQGWQTKLMPDSRALKKLGLGPDYSNAINAKTSNFVETPTAGSTSPDQASGFASAAGISR